MTGYITPQNGVIPGVCPAFLILIQSKRSKQQLKYAVFKHDFSLKLLHSVVSDPLLHVVINPQDITA